ncbi:MAG: YitT family protein [Candidatus Coprovivens sp.]
MEKVKRLPIIGTIIQYLLIVFGCCCAAFAVECTLVPNSILDGGVTGISIILNLLMGWRLSLLIFLINIPFIYVGFKNMGYKFLIKAVFSIAVFSIFLEIFNSFHYVFTDNILLATVYGSAILGVGVGLVIHNGGCLDGTESVGIVISKNTNFSVGQFVLLCNFIIFSVAGYFFGINRALYSLLAYFITSKIVDEVNEGLEKGKAAMIICDDGKKMAEHIYSTIGRTCTLIPGSGLISGEKDILYCVLTRIEISELRRIVLDEDQSAFITISDVSEIIGNHIKSNKALKFRKKVK